jgi:RND family efflux transporter MFP subunit
VCRGETLFRLLPRVEAGRSLAALESDKAALEAELATARGRLERLEGLLDVEAVSRREGEEARAREAALSARHDAAARDLQAARSARQGGGGGEAIAVSAPLAGEVSAVNASPGAAVAGGETLARVVRTDAVWLAVAVAVADAPASFAEGGLAGAVIEPADGEPLHLDASEVRLVAVAPEVDPANGTVDVLVETAARPELVLGTVVDVVLLAAATVEGIVVPASALVDDGGVPVVYLQLSGERFARQAVRVVERQGEWALVEGLVPGQRLVTRGGAAVRRSSMMGSGDSHGHVH